MLCAAVQNKYSGQEIIYTIMSIIIIPGPDDREVAMQAGGVVALVQKYVGDRLLHVGKQLIQPDHYGIKLIHNRSSVNIGK